ncbi:hypothetical protein THAOC_09347, partial [Thalassiosira oceanica]
MQKRRRRSTATCGAGSTSKTTAETGQGPSSSSPVRKSFHSERQNKQTRGRAYFRQISGVRFEGGRLARELVRGGDDGGGQGRERTGELSLSSVIFLVVRRAGVGISRGRNSAGRGTFEMNDGRTNATTSDPAQYLFPSFPAAHISPIFCQSLHPTPSHRGPLARDAATEPVTTDNNARRGGQQHGRAASADLAASLLCAARGVASMSGPRRWNPVRTGFHLRTGSRGSLAPSSLDGWGATAAAATATGGAAARPPSPPTHIALG